MEEDIIGERKEKIISLIKKPTFWVIGLLLVALILGVYTRSLPMQTRPETGKPGLWDITTNTWTLGPDLDPWLFLRYADTIVEEGSLPEVDNMRYVPVGYEPARETKLLPYMIAGTYYFFNIFSNINIEFAGVVFPVVMFALTILVFFLFVREIFVRKSKKSKFRANVISIIATFFMIVIPIFLSRTIAGIPEKESAGFFFMFLSFYLFLRAWKSDSWKKGAIFGILAGISTALMGLVWGGVIYVFITVAIASLLAFILNKVRKKEFIVYSLWFIVSWATILLSSSIFTLRGLATSINTGLALFVFIIMIVHFILWRTKLKNSRVLQKSKLPKNITSLIVAIVVGLIFVSVLFGPGFIFKKAGDLNQMLFKPVTGRWQITVAENRQPYFSEWKKSFGPFIKNIPVLFWLFFIGSVVLFRKMLDTIKKKDAWVLTGLYVLFFFGLVFSRYSSSSTFNGTNFISQLFYYGSALLLIGALIYYYIQAHKRGERGFEAINYNYLFLFTLFILTLFTARSAVRLIMVLAPVAPIFLGYLIFHSVSKFKRSRDDTSKIFMGVAAILILILSIFIFINFYNSTKGQAYYFIPSTYNQQWQRAMSWVRDETPEGAVFAHWWDYGYWVQSIGKRATVVDGGNAIRYWNYLVGRLVLTGDNEKDALNFLYSHNATHLLIDPTDLGKYGAFSSIGSDENFDRYSSGPVSFVLDTRQTVETAEGTFRVYNTRAGEGQARIYSLWEDIIYQENDTEVFLPSGSSGIVSVVLEMSQKEDDIIFKQPKAVFVYRNKQYSLPLRYLYIKDKMTDFGKGLEGTAYVIQKAAQVGNNIKIDELGAVIYISPRLMRGMLAQKYILGDPFDNFPNIKLIHKEHGYIVDALKSQGFDAADFIWFGGLQSPIKIWEIHYTGNEEFKEEYVDTDYTKYIGWQL